MARILDVQPRRGLTAANDPALRRLIEADDDAARDAEIARLVVAAQRAVRCAAASFAADEWTLSEEDLDDVAATAALRLVRKLHGVAVSESEAIASFSSYLDAVAQHAVQEVVRRRFPERNRLRNRLRYLLTRDARFALWRSGNGRTYAGLAGWDRLEPAERAISPDFVPRGARDAKHPAEALVALFRFAGGPLPFARLVALTAALWDVVEAPQADGTDSGDVLSQLIAQHSLIAVWREIRELREPQRAALLLNLRDGEGLNAADFLLVTGVATFDELAEAAGMTPERLAVLWNDLPLDDLSIAAALGVTRQHVINLRKAARERLRRRLGVNR